MKIKELYIENYKCFQEPFKLSFEDTLNGGILDRALITGANGSGKTTILELIVTFLSFAAQPWKLIELKDSKGYLTIELDKIERGKMNFSTNDEPLIHFRKNCSEKLNNSFFLDEQTGPGSPSVVGTGAENFRHQASGRLGETEGASPFWGGVVYFPHYRSFPESGSNELTTETPKYNWINIYPRRFKGARSIQNYLNYLFFEDFRKDKFDNSETHKFHDALKEINKLLFNKKIDYIDEQRRIFVTHKSGARHPIEDLSSGEKHLLLLLIEIERYCWPGSVLLIDEPETSLHTGMQDDLLFKLDDLCKEKNIQLIMASQSESIFNMMHPHESFVLSSLRKGAHDKVKAL